MTFTFTPWWLLACNIGDPGLIPWLEDPLEKQMAAHSSILAWRIPWTEEPGSLQVTGSQGVRHNWATNMFTFHSLSLFFIVNHIRLKELFLILTLCNSYIWVWNYPVIYQMMMMTIESCWFYVEPLKFHFKFHRSQDSTILGASKRDINNRIPDGLAALGDALK